MTLAVTEGELQCPMTTQADLEMEVAGLSAIEIVDEFLRVNSERQAFSGREVIDLLLDLRLVLQKSLTSS